MKTHSLRKAGFTLVEIMIVVAIIGMLAAIAIPNFIKARETAQANACINNLRQIDGAKQQWALENGKVSSSTPTPASLAPYLGRGTAGATINQAGQGGIACPAGGTYTINDVGTAPTCSLSTQSPNPHVLPN